MCKCVNNLLKIIKQLMTLHISVNNIFHHLFFLDEEVDLPALTPLTQQDVMLSFPNDSDSEAGNEINTSGIYSGSQDDNLSELLSASQLAHLYKESDYLDPAYIPLKSGLSSVSDDAVNTSSSNDDEGTESESSENILFTCSTHNVCFENPTEFELHQLESHMDERGKVECGLCDKKYSTKYLRRTHFSSIHMKERYACCVENCGKVYRQKRYKDNHERSHYPANNDANLRYVCDKCDLIVDSLDKLQQHRLTHSVTKKFPCRVCKKKGYGRLNDCTRHEIKCCETHNVKIVDGIVVQRTGETSEDDLETQKVRRNLFPSEQLSSGKGAKPKMRSRCDSGKKNIQTPEQLFPMEQTVHSRSKPDMKPKVPSGKPNNKKLQKQSSD